MGDTWRLLDSGLASAARHIAMNRALLEAARASEVPATLRFARFSRCVLVGSQQSAAAAIDVEACAAEKLPLQRRVSGGRAAYIDEQHLVWELYLHRRELRQLALRDIARNVCHAAATALAALGPQVGYRAPAELESDGRELGSGWFATDGDAVLFQSALRIDADPVSALRVLRTPWSASPQALRSEAAKRHTSLASLTARPVDLARVKHNLVEALESEFDVEFRESDVGLSEHARAEIALREIDCVDWVEHIKRPGHALPLVEVSASRSGAALRAALTCDPDVRTLRDVWFLGEVPLRPHRALPDLEAALRDTPVERIANRVSAFFASHAVQLDALTPADFVDLLAAGTRQRLVTDGE
jgi:lipoate-protein ligase A